MKINEDFTKPVLVDAQQLDWIASPAAGVDRRMLFRIGGEVARATSIVRYAPGSQFPRHAHGGGEEILVLEGTFQDEHGDYPAGSYFRNPPGTSHIPAAKDGCTIFVRLWQFRQGDETQIVRQPGEGDALPLRDGALAARLLFQNDAEEVRIEEWEGNATVSVPNAHGIEFIVLAGSISIDGVDLGLQGWGRLPAGMPLEAHVGAGTATIWIKEAEPMPEDVLEMPV
jgi:quercetin dioxygenase-like cupin family protein